jgi:hypothetical protein
MQNDLGVDIDEIHRIQSKGITMKSFYALGIAVLLMSSSSYAAETDWVRIGQGKDYIVDVNKLSVSKNKGIGSAIARFLPRSSSPDIKGMDANATLYGPKPTFFILTSAIYNCSTLEVTSISETNFDTNVQFVGDSKREGFNTVPEEYALIRKYVCAK